MIYQVDTCSQFDSQNGCTPIGNILVETSVGDFHTNSHGFVIIAEGSKEPTIYSVGNGTFNFVKKIQQYGVTYYFYSLPSCGLYGTRNSAGQCVCDSGYYVDPVSGKCVPTPDCGSHGHWNGSKCVCDTGYYTNSLGNCVPIPNCGAHGSWNGWECVCDSGYHKDSSGTCVKDTHNCGSNAHWDGTKCVCDSGYQKDSSGICVKIPTYKTVKYEAVDSKGNSLPGIDFLILGETYTTNTAGIISVKINSADHPKDVVYKVYDPNGKYINFAYLKTINGILIYQGKLSNHPCGLNAHWDGTKCVCDTGYQKDSSGYCIRITTYKTIQYEAIDSKGNPLSGIKFLILGKTYTTDTTGIASVKIDSADHPEDVVYKVYDPTGKYTDFVAITKTQTKVVYQGKLKTKTSASSTSGSIMLLVGAAMVLGILLLNQKR